MMTPRPSENEEHPSIRQLIKWLGQPHRTADEFNYVIGTLAVHVCRIMKEHFHQYIHKQPFIYYIYLHQIAAESLATIQPVLEGAWECAVLLVVQLFKRFTYTYSTRYIPSDRLAAWAIRVIRDDNLCPNSHLRMELVCLLATTGTSPHYQEGALNAVMFAISAFDINYLETPYYGEHSMFNFQILVRIFQNIKIIDIF